MLGWERREGGKNRCRGFDFVTDQGCPSFSPPLSFALAAPFRLTNTMTVPYIPHSARQGSHIPAMYSNRLLDLWRTFYIESLLSCDSFPSSICHPTSLADRGVTGDEGDEGSCPLLGNDTLVLEGTATPPAPSFLLVSRKCSTGSPTAPRCFSSRLLR